MTDKKPELEDLPKDSEPASTALPRAVVDPLRDLYLAVSRVALDRNRVIAPGIELRRTYAHTFAHPMLATSPPVHEHTHHPPPWQAVDAPGVVETATVELVLLQRDTNDVDRLTQAQNIVSLIRLIAGSPVRAPVCSNIAFSEMAAAKNVAVRQFEAPINWPIYPVLLDDEILAGIENLLEPMQALLRDDQFNSAFSLANSMWWLPSLSAQMITIWTAAEALMRPDRKDMTKQLARSIRAYSGTSRRQGDNLYQRVISLCRARGEATHAGRQPKPEDVQESYFILRALLLRALTECTAPGTIETIAPLWQQTAGEGPE
ncbi:hypothetical protein [Rhizobium johnstonii]|uniref:hypothetical protein n=1 Tax=Rhizobium johnstonii TaxID=3019933 RepID=UPI003F9481C2